MFRVLLHTLLTFMTGGLWLMMLLIAYLLKGLDNK